MPHNNIFGRPHFFVKGTFKPHHSTKFHEKYLHEIFPSISLILFIIIQRSAVHYSKDIVPSLKAGSGQLVTLH